MALGQEITSQPSARIIVASGEIADLVTGQSLKLETSPDGEELFNEQVPAGKKWNVIACLRITETDT